MEQFTAEFWEAGSHVFGNSRRLEILDHVLKFSGGNGVRASE